MIHCPEHGLQFVGNFCQHLRSDVDANRPATLYMRQGRWTFHLVCPECLSPEAIEVADHQICEACVTGWVAITHNEAYQAWRMQDRDEPIECGPFKPNLSSKPSESM
jgi:hypothetical protein